MIKVRTSRLSLLKLPHNVRSERDIFGKYWIIKEQKPQRYYEVLLNDLMTAAGNDTELRSMIQQVIQRMSLGYTDQNGSSETHQTANQAESVLGNQNARPDFVNMPNANRKPHPNGPNTESLVPPKVPANRNVSTMPDSYPNNPNASVDSNTQNPQISGYRRSVRGSLFLSKKSPSFLFKSYSCDSTFCKDAQLHFIASDTAPDLDSDAFTYEQLQTWANQIQTEGLALTYDHGHSVKDEIGVLKNPEVRCEGQYCRLEVMAALHENHPTAKDILRNAKNGRVLEFSITGTQPKNTVKDRAGIRHISDSRLLDISVVSHASNKRAKLLSVNN